VSSPITLLLCGDVMIGRGIDQVLEHRVDPRLHEPWVQDARDYVVLAERRSGAIPRGAPPAYPWGDALGEIGRRTPDARIINLETSITTRSRPSAEKRIHYRMHPDNVGVLSAAGVDCCVLANNHVLDWGRRGLVETLTVLRRVGIATAGAGTEAKEAAAAASMDCPGKGRVHVFAVGSTTSGIPASWRAEANRPGLCLIDRFGAAEAAAIGKRIDGVRRTGDVVVISIHWGANWGYPVPETHCEFAHRLIEAGADLVHGHSSHHPLGIEVYRGKPILYGCGDLLNDYEGIAGHAVYRPELSMLYFVTMQADSRGAALSRLELVPMRIRRFRLETAAATDAEWLRSTLDANCRPFGTAIRVHASGSTELDWQRD